MGITRCFLVVFERNQLVLQSPYPLHGHDNLVLVQQRTLECHFPDFLRKEVSDGVEQVLSGRVLAQRDAELLAELLSESALPETL